MKSFFELREAASVRSADKKPEQYIGPDGKPKIRMVPVDRKVIKNEQAEDDMPASPDEKSMAMDQAKFLQYVGKEVAEYLNKNKEFPEWMQNKLSGLHEKAKDMHAVLAGDYEDDDEEDMKEAMTASQHRMAMIDKIKKSGAVKSGSMSKNEAMKKPSDKELHKTLAMTKNKEQGISALMKNHGMDKGTARAHMKRLMGEETIDEVLDTPKAMDSYRAKAQASRDRAAKSATAINLRSKDRPEREHPAKDLKTMAKRTAGLRMADKAAMRKTYKALRKEEAEIEEAAPKMKGDWLKKEREKNRQHDAAMGRTPTGRKKPVRQMTSTQRALAKLRGDK